MCSNTSRTQPHTTQKHAQTCKNSSLFSLLSLSLFLSLSLSPFSLSLSFSLFVFCCLKLALPRSQHKACRSNPEGIKASRKSARPQLLEVGLDCRINGLFFPTLIQAGNGGGEDEHSTFETRGVVVAKFPDQPGDI